MKICKLTIGVWFIGITLGAQPISSSASSVASKKENDSAVARRDASLGQRLWYYLPNRFNDLLDLFGVNASIGFGLLASVKTTNQITFGVGTLDGFKLGTAGRNVGLWGEQSSEGGIPFAYYETWEIEPALGNIERGNSHPPMKEYNILEAVNIREKDPWAIRVAAHAGVAGGEFSLHLKELLDFPLGWFTIDISDDDW